MNVLALEPYYGGSHKAFLDGCQKHSRHNWTIIHASPNKWKWRMHHCPITFAHEINERIAKGETWDRLFCSEMMDLATLFGFCPALASLTSIVYFHENQLSYPLHTGEKRDLNYGFMNMKTALCADEVWFNSHYHQKEFLHALDESLKLMPDKKLAGVSQTIAEKALVIPQGIDSINFKDRDLNTIPHILWAARWEYDKNPALFFDALSQLTVDFNLSVIGESFRNTPPLFDDAKEQFKDQIIHWGYQESRTQYLQVLEESDIIVSTAKHEFFGISVVEAVHAGCQPLVPNALAYPEVLNRGNNPGYFYDGSQEDLSTKLETLLSEPNHLSQESRRLRHKECAKFTWDFLGPIIDEQLNKS